MGTGHVTTLIRCVIALNGLKGPEWFKTGDATIKPSYVVMEDDIDEVTICTADAPPIGIAGEISYLDLMTAYADGIMIPVWMRGCGVSIYVAFDNDTGAATYTRGGILVSDDANSGCVMIFAYGDADEDTDSPNNMIGILMMEVTTTADALVYVPCRMSI